MYLKIRLLVTCINWCVSFQSLSSDQLSKISCSQRRRNLHKLAGLQKQVQCHWQSPITVFSHEIVSKRSNLRNERTLVYLQVLTCYVEGTLTIKQATYFGTSIDVSVGCLTFRELTKRLLYTYKGVSGSSPIQHLLGNPGLVWHEMRMCRPISVTMVGFPRNLHLSAAPESQIASPESSTAEELESEGGDWRWTYNA